MDLEISVIIMDYNRKEYLLSAFKSAYNQTLSKDKYEIIVTKNFKDIKSDEYLKKHGAKLIFFKEGTYGEQLVDALKHAKGNIICVLEDDDLFLKNKLTTIYKLFKKNENLGYVNNARYYIDKKGRVLKNGLNRYERGINFYIKKRHLLSTLRLEKP